MIERLGDRIWRDDLGAGVRTLSRRSGFTAVAVLTLALGLGANALVASLLSTVVFAPLPYAESERLAVLWQQAPIPGYGELPLSVPDYLDLRELDGVFESLAVFEFLDVTRTGIDRPVKLRAVAAAPDLFSVLRAEAELGRLFSPADARPGGEPTAVLGHAFWRRELGADPAAVGRRMVLDGRAYKVVGVASPELRFPFPITWQGRTFQRPPTDVFLARTLDPAADRGDHSLLAVGRLAAGTSLERANERLGAAMAKLAAAHAGVHPPGMTARLVSASAQASAAARPALFVLFAAVVLLLLVASANVAVLLLARAAERAKEMSLRCAFGATRGRLVRRLMSESLVLGLLSGALGTLLAAWGVRSLSRLAIEEMPRLSEARLDAAALGWCAVLVLGTTLLFGLGPAFYAARTDLVRALKELGRGLSAGPLEGRLVKGVVVAEVVFSVALLTVAGWMIRGYQAMRTADPGFDLEGVTAVELNLAGEAYAEDGACRYTVREVLASVSDLPEVAAAGVGSYLPLAGQENAGPFTAEGGAPPPPGELRLATLRQVTPGFLEALGIRVVAGRLLRESDDAAGPRVVLVNRALASRAWPDADPIGRRLTVDDPASAAAAWWTVAGVTADVRDRRLDGGAEPTIYFPFAQSVSRQLTLVVRAAGGLADSRQVIEEAIWSVDPGLPVRLRSLEGVVGDVLARFELNAFLLTLFAAAALVLSACGIFALMAFLVERRRHEMAIRQALGATAEGLASLVVRQAMTLALPGAVLGLVAALALSRVLRSAVHGLNPVDPVILVGVPAVLFGLAVAASIYPARRAARIDAAEALRAE